MTRKHVPGISTGHSRGDRLVQEFEHDPYHASGKLKEPTVCPECHAVFHDGRWRWRTAPAGAHETLCPACRRIRDRVPAAFLRVGGDFAYAHRDEIRHLIDNVVERERAEHPLKRVMTMEESDGVLSLTLTDPHLARGIGEALHHAYQGVLDFHYVPGDILLRVSWHRDA
jgi:NMD protein affecting ribosome stability and mRNA decay